MLPKAILAWGVREVGWLCWLWWVLMAVASDSGVCFLFVVSPSPPRVGVAWGAPLWVGGGLPVCSPCAGLGWSALGAPGPLGLPAWVAPPVGASLVGVVLPPLSWGRPLGPPPWGPWGAGSSK